MRVIAGSAKRIILRTPEGMNTRPTADRIKETLFNMIALQMRGAYFLDLFCGSGAIGIEALSRGAKRAVFVDRDRAAMKCVRENLKRTRLAGSAELYGTGVMRALRLLESRERFDFIFMDPPYNTGSEKKVLEYLTRSELLSDDGIVIAESSLRTDFSYASDYGFREVRVKEYKTNKHVFLKKEEENADSGLSGEF